jgi:hypothetical protein
MNADPGGIPPAWPTPPPPARVDRLGQVALAEYDELRAISTSAHLTFAQYARKLRAPKRIEAATRGPLAGRPPPPKPAQDAARATGRATRPGPRRHRRSTPKRAGKISAMARQAMPQLGVDPATPGVQARVERVITSSARRPGRGP